MIYNQKLSEHICHVPKTKLFLDHITLEYKL